MRPASSLPPRRPALCAAVQRRIRGFGGAARLTRLRVRATRCGARGREVGRGAHQRLEPLHVGRRRVTLSGRAFGHLEGGLRLGGGRGGAQTLSLAPLRRRAPLSGAGARGLHPFERAVDGGGLLGRPQFGAGGGDTLVALRDGRRGLLGAGELLQACLRLAASLQARLQGVARLLRLGRVRGHLGRLERLSGPAVGEVVDRRGLRLSERLVVPVAQRPSMVAQALGGILERLLDGCEVPGVEERAQDLLALPGVRLAAASGTCPAAA